MMTANLLKSIQQSIVPTSRLLDGSVPIKLHNNLCDKINCYAYSLGIMYQPQLYEYVSYSPGFTTNNSVDWETNLLGAIKVDLDNLEVTYRQLYLHEPIALNDGEYLVKVFQKNDPTSPDFHFARYDPNSGVWFHKEGYYLEPRTVPVDSHNAMFSQFGKEPKNYRFGTYDPCGYFVIAEPS